MILSPAENSGAFFIPSDDVLLYPYSYLINSENLYQTHISEHSN
ncbi:hypothetical protein BH11BAC2_BH11BAC2_26370 [soil metagenome]